MRKRIPIGLSVLLIVGLSGADTKAQCPDPASSTVDWQVLGNAAGCGPFRGDVCPQGDASFIRLKVVALDSSLIPCVNVPVSANVIPNPIQPGGFLAWCLGENPQTGITDLTGTVVFRFEEFGADGPFGPPPERERLTVQVIADGVPLNPPPNDIWANSPDQLVDLMVGLPDLGIFAIRWGSGDPRADFNCDGVVGLPDLGVMGAHWGHRCTP